MGSLIFIVVLVIAAVVISAVLKGRLSSAGDVAGAYEARNELFSPAERSFYGVLERVAGGEYKVLGKVRLGDVVQPARGLSKSRRTSLRNRVQQKHADFVLCCPDTLKVLGVVELDDASHARPDRTKRDSFVDQVLVSAGIPVLRFPARKAYAVAEVRAKLVESFSLKVKAGVENPAEQAIVKAPAIPVGPQVAVSSEQNDGVASSAPSSGPICPACNSAMVKRQAKNGPNAGQWFWACSAFPKCRKIMAIGNG